MEQIILPKNIFLPHFEIVQNFHYFVRSAPVDFPSKIQFSKTPSNVVEMFFWWVEQIILPKNIFLPHFEIVQNFHYFVTSAPVDFPSKIQFSKTASNVVEMFLLMSGTNNFAKKYFLTPFWDSTKFSLFFNGRACRFSVKNSIFQNSLKCCRNVSFDEWNK